MEVPDKIYIELTPNGKGYYWDIVKEVKQSEADIEYTRTDAFIEKAVSWIENNFNMPNDFQERLKKAMKL